METAKISQYSSDGLAGRRKLILALMLIAVIVTLAYLNTLENQFVFDDFKIIRDNTTIRSFSGIPRIFANMFVYQPLKGQGTRIDPSYRPVRYLSYAIDYQFTGFNPAGYHISNIIYHVIATFLVFLVLRRFTGHFGASLGVALIFAVHPVHTESVAYLTGRKDVLCTIFYLLAFLSFLKYRSRPKVRYAVQMPVFFAIAFMAKEMAITLPVVMLLYDFGRWLKEREGPFGGFIKGFFTRRNLAIYTPVVLLAFFFSAAALFLKNPAGMGEEWIGYWGGSLYVSSITMLRGIVRYMRLLVIPLGLTADYSYNTFPVSQSLFSPFTTLLSLAFLAVAVALGIYLLRRRYFLAGFAILFFFVTLIPVLQVVPLPERLAERFLYLPSLGLVLLAAAGLGRLVNRGGYPRALGVSATVLLVIVFFVLTARRNTDWKDPLSLHGSVIRLHPDCARSQLAVAEEYALRANAAKDAAEGAVTASAQQDYFNAVHHFTRVLEILPPETWQGWRRGFALNALAGRGIALGNLGKQGRAICDLERVLGETDVYGTKISQNPDYLHVHFNLGELYYSIKKYGRAIEEFDTAARMANEKNAEDYLIRARYKKALSLAGTERLSEGLDVLLETLKTAGGTLHEISLQYHAGLFMLDLKQNEDAVKSFEKVLELCERYERSPAEFEITDPKAALPGVGKAKRQASYMMAQALDRSGNFKGALAALEKTVELAPDFIEAHFSLGDFYFRLGKLKAAEREFRRVLKDVPDDSRSRQYLVLIEVKRKAAEERKKPTPQKVLLLYEAALRDYGAGELAKAQDKLAEALHIAGKLGDKPKPLVSRVRLLLGRIHYDKGGLDSAKTHCRAGLDILSGMKTEGIEFQLGELHYWLGVTLAKQAEEESALTRFRKAFPYLRKAAKSSRSAVEAADLLVHSARANTALGQFDEALSDYISAVEILPQYPNVHYLTAQTAQRAGKMPQAARFYTLSMKKGEKVTESSYEMGKLLFEAGKHTDAITSLLAALEKTTEPYYLAACNYYLGHAFYEIELFDEAADAWREYLKHEKDPDKRELVIKRIETDPRLKGK